MLICKKCMEVCGDNMCHGGLSPHMCIIMLCIMSRDVTCHIICALYYVHNSCTSHFCASYDMTDHVKCLLVKFMYILWRERWCDMHMWHDAHKLWWAKSFIHFLQIWFFLIMLIIWARPQGWNVYIFVVSIIHGI